MTPGVWDRHAEMTISIHMPHTWHDVQDNQVQIPTGEFQSTCHIRGMTYSAKASDYALSISIHMPHTWHDDMLAALWIAVDISIHMPHTWHDSAVFKL